MPLISFYFPGKLQKTKGFLMFSGGIEKDQLQETGVRPMYPLYRKPEIYLHFIIREGNQNMGIFLMQASKTRLSHHSLATQKSILVLKPVEHNRKVFRTTSSIYYGFFFQKQLQLQLFITFVATAFSFRVLNTFLHIRGVFRTQSNIYDGAFLRKQ